MMPVLSAFLLSAGAEAGATSPPTYFALPESGQAKAAQKLTRSPSASVGDALAYLSGEHAVVDVCAYAVVLEASTPPAVQTVEDAEGVGAATSIQQAAFTPEGLQIMVDAMQETLLAGLSARAGLVFKKIDGGVLNASDPGEAGAPQNSGERWSVAADGTRRLTGADWPKLESDGEWMTTMDARSGCDAYLGVEMKGTFTAEGRALLSTVARVYVSDGRLRAAMTSAGEEKKGDANIAAVTALRKPLQITVDSDGEGDFDGLLVGVEMVADVIGRALVEVVPR